MVRLGLETQGRLGTGNGLPGRDRGTGTTLPTADLRRGDAYFHTGQGCLFIYNGAAWRQAEIPVSSSATAALYDGQYRDHPTLGLQRSSGTAWVTPGDSSATGTPPEVPYATNVIGYTDAVAGWSGLRYWKRNGVAAVHGAYQVTVASGNFALLATLPDGFRPAAIVTGMSGDNTYQVRANGQVIQQTAKGANYINSFGITFPVA